MKHGVILDQDSLGPADLDLAQLYQCCDSWDIHRQTSALETQQRCANAEVIVSNKVVLDDAILSQCPALKLVLIAATGTNNIDLNACQRLNITVCNVPAYGPDTVAQHTWGLILALSTQLLNYAQNSRNGQWSQSSFFCLLDHPIIELKGKTLGIIGYGIIGQSVARIAEAFGMTVKLCRRPAAQSSDDPRRIDINELLAQSDIISLHCPLTSDNHNLIDQAALEKMKKSAFLINTSRGGLVNETDLSGALNKGVIAGAALDVLSQEPPPIDHILLKNNHPNLIITPHSAWASREARQRLVDIMADNLHSYYRNRPINRVC